MLKVSVVTITYNDGDNLKKTLDALLHQDYKNIESVIVDGGSTDGSVDVIRAFAERFKGEVNWVSEKDNGMGDAINKGLKMATGDIIGCYWDVYARHDVISKMVHQIEKENTDGVHGDLLYLDGTKIKRYWKMGVGRIQDGWMPAHPTLYLRKEVYQKYGLYNEKYRYCWDYEFIVRSLKDGTTRLSYIPEILIYMYYGGATTSGFGAYKKSILDSEKALVDNQIKHPWFVTFKRILKTSLQFLNNRKANEKTTMK